MRYTWLLAAFSLILVAAGCSSSNRTGKSEGEDPTEFARTTKQQVQQFVRAAKETPKSAGGQAEALLERLTVYKSRPVGDNGPIYEQLLEKCKEIVDSAKRSPGSAEVMKKVEEMAALASKLPG
jgi:hypothetical protein